MLIRTIIVLFFQLLFFVEAIFALKVTEMSRLDKLLIQGELYTMGEAAGDGDFPLHYIKFGKIKGSSGSLIFVNGKGENIVKYIELFYDLYSRGFSPIYAYDHRGQGFSQPISPSAANPLTENYYPTHRRDLSAFIRFILNDEGIDRQKLFLVAHSMGGAVVLDYLQQQQKGEPSPFKAMVFSAPMIKIKTNIVSKFLLLMVKGWHYLFPSSWRFPSLRDQFIWTRFTSSRMRYDFSERVTEELFPQAKSRGTSLKWLLESLKITDLLMDEARLDKLKTPLLILQSEQESFVSNSQMDIFCRKIRPLCRVEKISGKHEIFLEKDGPRDQAIGSMIDFFGQKER